MACQHPSPLPGSDAATDLIKRHAGQRLRTRRILLRITQEQLARALGISRSQLQRHESGRSAMSATALYHAAFALNVPPDWFFEGLPTTRADLDSVREQEPDKATRPAARRVRRSPDGETRWPPPRLIAGLDLEPGGKNPGRKS